MDGSSSTAHLFVDVVGAFDGLVRQIVMGCADLPGDDLAVAKLLNALGFGPQAMYDFARVLANGSILEKAAVPLEIRRSVCDAHSHTWFSMQGRRTVSEVLSGSRPGDPLGDIVFKVLETSIHSDISQELSESPAVLRLQPLPPHVVPPFLSNDVKPILFNNCR